MVVYQIIPFLLLSTLNLGELMTEDRVKRKLTAILSADVKGYSRLMGEDELGTVRTLEAYREMISEVIRDYSGRVVDSPGPLPAAAVGCDPHGCRGASPQVGDLTWTGTPSRWSWACWGCRSSCSPGT